MPPPKNVIIDQPPSQTTIPGREGDITVPTRSWRSRVPPELSKELETLRRFDTVIRDALKDPETTERFLVSPVGVLDDLKIPIPPDLRKRLSAKNGINQLLVPHRLRLPGNPVITPVVNVRINDRPSTPTLPLPLGQARLFNWWNPFKPSGLLDNGYPVVYEIAKSCIRDLLAQWFDRAPLSAILNDLTQNVTDPALQELIKLANLVSSEFDLDLDLGIPSGMTTSYPDILTITAQVPQPGSTAANSSSTVRISVFLRIAASLVVDHSDPQREQFYLDLANCLADCEAKITFANIPMVGTKVVELSSPFSEFLRTHYPRVNVFFDVPIDRSGASELKPTQVDIKIIDDSSSADSDTLALMLSFADMGPGNRAGFTQSFVGDGSGLVIDFNWLRAKILPELERALNLPTPIDRTTGMWTGTAPISGGEGANLTFLALGVLQGSRDVTVMLGISKDGDCYSASASMAATLSIGVDQGKLIFQPPQFSSPSVDVDIPWECYLLSILVGGVLGSIVFGEIGTVVGTIVAPLLLHSIQGVAEGIVQSAVETVNSTLQNETAGIQQLDLGFLKLAVQDASFDDLLVFQKVDIVDSIPALTENTAFIPNGGYLDLVTGQIAPLTGNVGNLAWVGTGSNRVLMSLGNTALALVGNLDPACVTRYRLYHCSFSTSQRLTLTQLADRNDSQYQPNGLVYAAHTEDGHYARFTITEIADDGLWLHYKTYPRAAAEQVVVPTVELRGQFVARPIQIVGTSPKPKFQSLAGTGSRKWGTWIDPNVDWCDNGTFYANWIGFKEPLLLNWKVQDQELTGNTGTITVNGTQIRYEMSGAQLNLMLYPIVIVAIEIEAELRDADGHQGVARIIVHTVAGGLAGLVGATMSPGVIPPLDEYLVAYRKHVGPWTEIDPASIADQGYRV